MWHHVPAVTRRWQLAAVVEETSLLLWWRLCHLTLATAAASLSAGFACDALSATAGCAGGFSAAAAGGSAIVAADALSLAAAVSCGAAAGSASVSGRAAASFPASESYTGYPKRSGVGVIWKMQ